MSNEKINDETKTNDDEKGVQEIEGSKPENKKADPIKKITKIVLGICIAIFIWYLFADRYTPFTDQARIKTLIVPIVPRVSGHLTDVNVRLHSLVSDGELLFQIDTKPFELAILKAEADIDNTAQQVGALTATVKSAAGRLGVAKAQLDRSQRNYDRTQKVLAKNPGALSQADLDRTETSLAQSVEKLTSAEADLDKAKQQLGTSGPDNPQLRAAIVALEQAQLDLSFASVLSPSKGVIESFNVDVGHYAQAGQPLATFISIHDVWIQADLRENNISNIKPGNEVEFALDIAPGRVFEGSVRSIGYGVSSGENNNRGALPTISNSQGWLREPQRFPVIIKIEDEEAINLIRSGGQADIIIYAGESSILNLIAWFQIRISSWLSYAR